MSDEEFVRSFESCELSNASFHHRDHIRLAWIYLQRYGPVQAAERIAVAIRRFAAHHGKTDKYHETVTVAWMRLLAQADRRLSFAEVVAEFPNLLSKDYLREFYSDAVLSSQLARVTFLDPDKRLLSLHEIAPM